jgi:hypothetical protein
MHYNIGTEYSTDIDECEKKMLFSGGHIFLASGRAAG